MFWTYFSKDFVRPIRPSQEKCYMLLTASPGIPLGRKAVARGGLERPPTAELRPDQKDEDSLPPYSVLDPILKAYVEEDRALEDIVAMGFDRETVARVMVMVDRSEYKRRQAPLGIKITHRAFGKDRRMPITNGYR